MINDKFFILLNIGATTGTFSNVTGGTFTAGGDTFTINYADTGDATRATTFRSRSPPSRPCRGLPPGSVCPPQGAALGWKLRRRRA